MPEQSDLFPIVQETAQGAVRIFSEAAQEMLRQAARDMVGHPPTLELAADMIRQLATALGD